MCGRTNLTASGEELAEEFALAETPVLAPRYNIAPSQPLAVVRAEDGPRRLDLLTWGVPPAEGEPPGAVINARVESAHRRPFGEAFRRRRCLVPVTGFYEWRQRGRIRQPFLIRRSDGRPFGLGGLWQPGDEARCAILTTAANELLAPLHDRMPLIVGRAAYALWLDPASDREALEPLLHPAPPGELIAFPVSTRVNRPENDDPGCLEPAPEMEDPQKTLW
jgi:putative SOS response-associated peptidase YedK